MKIFILDHNKLRRESLALGLGSLDFRVEQMLDAEEALLFAEQEPDAFIIRAPLLEGSASALIRTFRARNFNFPVIVIATAEVSLNEPFADLLDAGADAILDNSVPYRVVAAQVQAIVRRCAFSAKNTIELGLVTLDLTTQQVLVKGEAVHLTGKEYGLLEALMLRCGTTLSKDYLLTHLYGGRDEPDIKIIDVFACKLRNKLGEARSQVLTEWGRGYRFTETPEEVASEGEGRPGDAVHKVLRLLGALTAPALSADIAAQCGLPTDITRGILSQMKRNGDAESIKVRRSPSHLWSITDTGRDRLVTLNTPLAAE